MRGECLSQELARMIDSGHVAYNEAGFRNFGSFIPPVSIHRRIFFDPVAAAENVSATAKMTPKRIAHLLAFPTIAGLAPAAKLVSRS